MPRINSALYFAVISDSVRNKILGDYLLTITIAVLSKPAIEGISALVFYFFRFSRIWYTLLGYLDITALSALLSSLVSTFLIIALVLSI